MNEPKRYRSGGYGAMVEAGDGRFALWEDMEKLIAERDALQRDKELLIETEHVYSRRFLEKVKSLQGAEELALIVAFVQGVAWWEYAKTGVTVWGSDRDLAEKEAQKRQRNGMLGKRF